MATAKKKAAARRPAPRLPKLKLVDVERDDLPTSPLEARAQQALGADALVKALGPGELVAQRGEELFLLGPSGPPRPVTGLSGDVAWPPYVLPGGKGMLVLSTENFGFAYRLWEVAFASPAAKLVGKGGSEESDDEGDDDADADVISWLRAVPVPGGYALFGGEKTVLLGKDGATVRDEAKHDDLSEMETVFDGRCIVLSEIEGPAVLYAVAGDDLVKIAKLQSDPRDIVVEGTRVFWNDMGTEDIGWKEVVGLHDALVAAGA